MPHRKKRVWIVAVAALALVPSIQLAWRFRDLPHLGRQNDDGIYLVSARSLAQSGGYRILSLPGEPYQTKYPPLYPLYLSIAWRLNPAFPANLPLVMALSWVLLPVFMALAWGVYRQLGYGWTAAWLLAALLAINPYSALFAVSPLSELLACALLFASLLTARSGRWALASGLFAGVAFLAKTALVVLIVAVPAYYLFKRRWAAAGLFVLSMLPWVAGWAWWSGSHRAPAAPITMWYTDYLGFYLDNFSRAELPSLMMSNLDVMFASIGGLVVHNSEHSNLPMHLFRILAFVCIFGVIRQARRTGVSPYHYFALAYLPVLLIWNYAPHQRFVFPIYPLLLGGLATEVAHMTALLRDAWRKPAIAQRALAAALGVVLVAFAAWIAWGIRYGLYHRLPLLLAQGRTLRPEMLQAYAWIKANVPQDASFLASDDPSLYLYTGRHASGMHAPTRGLGDESRKAALAYFSSMPELARSNGYSHILLTRADFLQDLRREDRSLARAAIDRDTGSIIVYRSGNLAVRRVVR